MTKPVEHVIESRAHDLAEAFNVRLYRERLEGHRFNRLPEGEDEWTALPSEP